MRIFLFCLLIPFFALSQDPIFNSSGLLVLSDGDMNPTSFYHNSLIKSEESSDALYGISFPITLQSSKLINKVKVSSSMISNSAIIEISNSNPKHAFVLETKGKPIGTSYNLEKSFENGSYISVIDISKVENQQALFRFKVAENPISIALNSANDNLAVCSEEIDNELQVIELDYQGKPTRKINKPATFGNDRISYVTWTKDGNFLVYTNETKKEIGLIAVIKDAPTQKVIRLETFGNPIKLGVLPGKGKFTNNGKYYIISDLKKTKTNINDNSEAELFVVKFNFENNGQHYLLSKVAIGSNLEDFEVHPTDEFIVASCNNQSFHPLYKMTDTQKGALYTLKLSQDGTITKGNSYSVNGSNLTNVQFDTSGNNLVVGVSSINNYGVNFSGIEFWEVNISENLELIKQPNTLYLEQGIHSIKAIN